MKKYIFKRILHSLAVMFAVVTVVFVAMRSLPGGPARSALGEEASPEQVAALEEQLGLNDPLYIQYTDYMFDLIRLDFGTSIGTGQDVLTMLMLAGPRTFWIGIVGVIIGLSIAIPTGIISATRRNEPIDYVATVFAFTGLSMPAFFIGILLALVFGVWLGLLPIIGYNSLQDGIVPWFQTIILPAIAVGLPYSAIVMRMTRSSLLEVQNQPYMQTARAKGLSKRVSLYKHALQNAMIPVITIGAIQVAVIITGSVTVELVFSINGLGRTLVNSMLRNDYTVIQGAIVIIAGVMVFTNLVVDILYTIIDPRIRYD